METGGVLQTPKRAAVFVVHGMGGQRPLDTLRGIVKAVWLEANEAKGRRSKDMDPAPAPIAQEAQLLAAGDIRQEAEANNEAAY